MNINSKSIFRVKKILSSQDVIFFEFSCLKLKGFLTYVDSITDRESLGELVLRPLHEYNQEEFNASNICEKILDF